jgi:hypothetical protein
MSEKFYDLIVQGVLIQGIIALALVCAVIYLAVTNQPIPDILIGLTGTAIGFYFGGEAQAGIVRRQEARALRSRG